MNAERDLTVSEERTVSEEEYAMQCDVSPSGGM
jgi:hypothetical protein